MNGKSADIIQLPVEHLSVAVIGAGFSGLAVARQLLLDGNTDFLVFDRGDTVGGTWRDSVYPGCMSDIPAVLYSYSFAPNPDWKSTYAEQSEILQYLQHCSTEFGVDPYLRFKHELRSASWIEQEQRWQIQTSRGRYTAKTLVLGTGYLSEANVPVFDGIEDYQGEVLHTSKWNPEVDLRGKRVAVIGNGASAIQVVPAIHADVEHLVLYQRTAQWITPKHQKAVEGKQAWAVRHIPGYQKLRRNITKWEFESLAFALRRPLIMKQIQKYWSHDLKKVIDDPELRRRLTPDFVLGCKRILFSDEYYPVLNKPNVEVVTEGIRKVTATGIEANDGTFSRIDAIVYATGYQATNLPVAKLITGRYNLKLSNAWRNGQSAYLGSSVSGFPNMFMMLGPNTTLTHTSMTLMIEAQANYIGDFVRQVKQKKITSVDVKLKKMLAYRTKMRRSIGGTVWSSAGGCSSWYQDSTGRNTTVWPSYAFKFKWMNRRFNPNDFDVRLSAVDKKLDGAGRLTPEVSIIRTIGSSAKDKRRETDNRKLNH